MSTLDDPLAHAMPHLQTASTVCRGYLDPAAVQRFFASHPVDALLACGVDSVFVASGHRTWLDEKMQAWMTSPSGEDTPRAGYAIVLPDGHSGLVANAVVRADAQAANPDELVLFGRGQAHADPEAALTALLEAMGLSGRTVAWEAQVPGAAARAAIDAAASANGCTLVDATIGWRLLKSIKSARAIERLRTVCALTEQALAASLPLWLQRGEPDAARRRFLLALAEHDADFDHFVWGMPGGGVSVRQPPQAHAGTLFFDAGARLDGFYSDTGLTLAHEAVSPRDAQRYAEAFGALNAGRRALRAGERASVCWRAMQRVVTDPCLVAQGHGLGTSIREWPFFAAETDRRLEDGAGSYPFDQTLEAGMVINLEVGGHWPDGASVQVEQTFLVGTDGAQPLARQPRTQLTEPRSSPRA